MYQVHSKMIFHGTMSFLNLCLSLLYLSVGVYAYSPVDLFSINCGSIGNSSDYDRSWIGDIDSKLLSPTDNPSTSAQTLTRSPSTLQIPYYTARLSHSEFTYSFPVTPGPKFLRLFFYPSFYQGGFHRSNAFFTVKSGAFTLLQDFNASLTADADDDSSDTIYREYCIYVNDGERLYLTFTPNATRPDSYAFINGIEVVSMPDYLYYTKPGDLGVDLVDYTTPFSVQNNFALETRYRLNVGGPSIPASRDSGMLRYWKSDDYYVEGITYVPADYEHAMMLSFSQIPNYTAPDQVYRTERSMGPNKTYNVNSNLTWVFPVDSGFTYLLRLHFCELNPRINDSNSIVFEIYIADQLAEGGANVYEWGKARGVPVYRDYAILALRDQNISLKMHPLPDIFTSYSDAFLNGLEIFRISNQPSKSLAGPNPDPLPPNPPNFDALPQINSKKSNTRTIIGIVVAVGVVSGVVLLSSVVFFLIRHEKKVKRSKSNEGVTESTNSTHGLPLPSELCRHFSISEIKTATNSFDELLVIGVGGFGHVYKGYIDGDQTPVAIKRLKPGSQQGAHEFKTEIEMLSQLRHRHLVSLIGYCMQSNEMILVYDFMARGTLSDHLYNTENPRLSWKQRLQICIGAARGLHYLHTGTTHPIIHRDVKSTNILLDDKWVGKISDFGLSRLGPTGMSKSYVSTVVKGSVGYLDPEYYKRQRLTEKSDVYSFGVVLFEVLCGRPPWIRTVDKRQVLLSDWAKHCHDTGTLGEIVDPVLRLKGEIAAKCLKKFVEVGVSCLDDDGRKRPSMNDVVWGLEFALQLQEEAEQKSGTGEGGSEELVEGEKNEDWDDT